MTIGEEKYEKMTRTPIPRLVISMAIPTTISTIITVIYNTADTWFVSQIHESAAAAIGVVYSIMAVLQAVGFGIGMGSGSLISRYLGKKQVDQANVFASSGLATSIAVGFVVGCLCLCVLEPLLRLIGASDTILPYAVPYARIILLGAPVSCSVFVLNNLLRAEGNTKLVLWGTMTGGILNLVLDPILIFSLRMGSGGAALATVLSQCANWCILFSAFARGKTILRLRLASVSRSRTTYLQILTTGSPTVLRQGLGSVSTTALNIQALVYGDTAVAAITIAGKIYTLVRQVVLGIGQGFQPVAGYNYGAGQRGRAFHAFCFATFLGTVVCVTAAIVLGIFAEDILWWFCASANVVRLGSQTLRIFCWVMPLLAFSTFVNQSYQCLGFSRLASLLASCRQGIFFLPAIVLLPRFLGILGVQITQSLADLMTFLLSIPFAIHFYRNIIRKHE